VERRAQAPTEPLTPPAPGSNLADKTRVSVCLRRGDCRYGARRSMTATAILRF